MPLQYHILADRRLAYQRLIGKKSAPSIIFLSGFGSDMLGTKATYLAKQCQQRGYNFLRFDYTGHGRSSGVFKEATLGTWLEDCLELFDHHTRGPQIIVGSSLGGWLALLLARARPSRIQGLIGIAAAPDFTEDLIWRRLSKPHKKRLIKQGFLTDPSAPPNEQYPITYALIQEARQHLLLRQPLNINCPVRLLQGMKDSEVPYQHALRIVDALTSKNVELILFKTGDHRLSEADNLNTLWEKISELSRIKTKKLSAKKISRPR